MPLAPSSFHAEGPSRTVIGMLAVVAVVAVYARLLAVLRDLERGLRARGVPPGGEPWWFGYARDTVNGFGLLGLTAGFAVLGVSPPVGLLLACGYGLAVYGADYLLGFELGAVSAWRRGARQTALVTLIALALLAPALAAPHPLAHGLAGAVDALFGMASW